MYRLFLAGLCCCIAWPGFAVSVPARPGIPGAVAQPKVRIAPPAPTARIVLPPLSSAEQAMKSLEDSPEKGVFQTGLFRDMPETVGILSGASSVGAWSVQPDGSRRWTLALESPSALGIRIEFGQLALPTGGEVWIFGDQSAPEGPLTQIPPGEASLWSATADGTTIVISCSLPADAPVESVQLRIDRIIHQYLLPGSLAAKAAGTCNIDENCEPAWDSTASGVGGLGVVGISGSLFCTCTLINDADPCGDTPFVLTANHCVGGQTGSHGASSLEFYWNYETNACNGVAPSPATVPRTTGGADYLAGSGGTGFTGGGSDYTLLRLRSEPPASLTRVGWNTNPQPVGTQVTCIHHPRGDYRRISHGELTDTDNPFSSLYHEVTWAQGTTEPGSSGSPLMLTATQQIIGQLWGGGASCSFPFDPDYYGRFDKSYTTAQSILTAVTTASLASVSATANESAGSVLVQVNLTTNAPPGGYSLLATLAAGTAYPGLDYTGGAIAFSIAAGSDSGSFSIPLINDTHTEPAETLTATISATAGCPAISSSAHTFTLTIADDDTDTDGDGISDADENSGFLGYVTNPLEADSDFDGINDAYEQSGTYGYNTNPNEADTDGDGTDDYTEIYFGTDPLVPNVNAVPSIQVPWLRELPCP
ncbi:MAG: hypothetical protein GC168_01210 [Candidatus Hydrogenedens sp.]|nr:hypothetical protein [Candidatus Hydrogenedens sp.]